MNRRIDSLLLAAFLAVQVSDASAADGRIEINQTCASSTGCMAGDSAGFPVTISARGSYLLTSDLNVPGSAHGIEVDAPFVALDLNGFAIAGSALFSTCGPDVVGDGVSGPSQFGVSVRNGRILGMSRSGIRLGEGARIDGVDVEQNCSGGLVLGGSSLVTNVRAVGNRLTGIQAGARSLVARSLADRNSADGIRVGVDSIVEGCVATGSLGAELQSGHGIVVGGGTVVRGNAASQNETFGVVGAPGALLLESVVNANGSAVASDPTMAFGLSVFYANGSINAPGVIVACDAINGEPYCP